MAAQYTDNFNRSDNTNIGGDWTEAAQDLQIKNNHLSNNTTNKSGHIAYVSGFTPATKDYEVQADVYTVDYSDSIASAIGPVGRYTDTTHLYHARVNFSSGDLQLYKWNGGATLLGSYALGAVEGTTVTVKLQMVGSTIKAFANGTERISVTDSDLTSVGSGGVRIFPDSSGTPNTDDAQIDNFSITNYPSIDLSDSITISESRSVTVESAASGPSVTVSDSVTLSEQIGIDIPLLVSSVSVSDSITVKETTSFPFSKALYFNGSSDYLTASMAPATTGFCLAFWLNVEALGNNEYLFDVTGGSNNGFRIIRSAGVNVKNLYFQVFNAGSNVAQIAYLSVSAFKPMHVVVTFAPNSAKLYVDKVLMGTDTSCTIGTFDGTFEIGRRNNGSSYMKMAIDRMVWRNTATPWTQTDVDNLYDFGTIPTSSSYWDFNDSLADLSGNGETLTVGSGTSYITSPMATISMQLSLSITVSETIIVKEPSKYAISLNGSNQYGTFTSPFTRTAGQPFTAITWFKTSTVGTAAYVIVGVRTGSLAGDLWKIEVNNLKASFQYDPTGSGATVASTNNVNDGKEHCAIGVYDGANVILYLDGTQAAISASRPNAAIDQTAGAIGKRTDTSEEYFPGIVGPTYIFTRALSPTEAEDHWEGRTLDLTNLQMGWQMKEGIGTKIGDISSNNVSVTLQNSPSWVEGFGNSQQLPQLVSFNTKTESITLTEALSVSISGDTSLSVNKSENITVSENTSLFLQINTSVQETITVSDTDLLTHVLNVTSTENISVTDIVRYWQDTVYVYESVNVEIVTISTYYVNKSENITISESVNQYLTINLNAGSQQFVRKITIDYTKVGTADVTDFVVGFIGTYSYLATEANGGKVKNTNGYDVRFFADSSLSIPLSFERVSWSATTGACEFYIKIPTVSYTVNTDFYIAYGNDSITTDQQNRSNTWSNNYTAVIHGNDTSSTTLLESSPVSRTVTKSGTNTPVESNTSIAGKAQDFSGTNCYFTIGATGDFNITNNLTIEVWSKLPSTSGSRYFLTNRGPTGDQWALIYGFVSNKYEFYSESGGTRTAFTTTVTDTNYHYVAYTYTTSQLLMYLDGSLDVTQNSPGTITSKTDGTFRVGSSTGGTDFFGGQGDEIRVSTGTIKTSSYFKATYNNLSSPSTFYSVGSESTFSAGETITVSESTKLNNNSNITSLDSITVTESTQRILETFINRFENVSVSESLALLVIGYIYKTESVSITESTQIALFNPTPPYLLDMNDFREKGVRITDPR